MRPVRVRRSYYRTSNDQEIVEWDVIVSDHATTDDITRVDGAVERACGKTIAQAIIPRLHAAIRRMVQK